MTHLSDTVREVLRDSDGDTPDGEAGVPASHPSHSVTTIALEAGVRPPGNMPPAACPTDPLHLKFRLKFSVSQVNNAYIIIWSVRVLATLIDHELIEICR